MIAYRSKILGLAACALAWGAPAIAQEQDGTAAESSGDADEASSLEDIIVTAQFRSESLQDAPLAITAVWAELLEARSQTNIAEVANQAPNVTLKPQGQSYGPSLGASIRGVGQFDFNPALEPAVGIYVDDVYYATLTGSVLDLLDLERVEILRGPQGTLAGKNSIGGAVRLYSRRPTGDNSGYVRVVYGARDRFDLRASADFALTEGVFARVAGVSKRQDGYVERLDFGCLFPASAVPATGEAEGDCLLARDGNINYQGVRGQLRFIAGDVEINLTGDYSIDSRNTPGSVLRYLNYTGAGDINPFGPVNYGQFFCGRYCNYATFEMQPDNGRPLDRADDLSRFEGHGFSARIEWRLSDNLLLESITGYRSYEARFTNDDDATPLAHSLGRNELGFWSLSQELRATGSIGSGDRLTYTVGGFYMEQESVYATSQNLRYASAAGVFVYGDDPVQSRTSALFAHLIWRATDRLSLFGGVRYTDEYKSYEFVRKNPDGTPNSPVDGVKAIYDGPESEHVDYRAGAQFDLGRDIMAYAQYSTGVKGGGVSPRPFAPLQARAFGPETVDAYEIGLKTELLDRTVRLNLAAFLSDYSGIQLSLGSCPEFNPTPPGPGAPFPCALTSNAADARVQGIEAEAFVRPAAGFLIDASASYLDFAYKEGSINPFAGDITRPAGPQYGNYPAYVPEWKWSAGAEYEIGLGPAGSLTPRLDASYQSEIYTHPSNRDVDSPTRARNRIDGYALVNARLTWANARGDIDIAAEVTNLFDEYHLLTLFDLTPNNAGVAVGQPGRPREWAVSLTKRF